MDRASALVIAHATRIAPTDWLRAAIVCGCALALILARAPLPFLPA